ncbi:jg5367 [Pararge aegeria aegeria]|uniref:Jg5367 protein n=1 Tax=Pararge aegeria aegeria TaxID=348720 RepID=A0A8S4QRI4_9NEOP|nr:jg5367 [Pararge aegeria aegeria]
MIWFRPTDNKVPSTQVEVDGSHATRRPRQVEYPSSSLVPTRWTKKIGSKRRKQRRWEDELKLTAGPLWRRVAQYCKHWRELEEAFAVWHTELRNLI